MPSPNGGSPPAGGGAANVVSRPNNTLRRRDPAQGGGRVAGGSEGPGRVWLGLREAFRSGSRLRPPLAPTASRGRPRGGGRQPVVVTREQPDGDPDLAVLARSAGPNRTGRA